MSFNPYFNNVSIPTARNLFTAGSSAYRGARRGYNLWKRYRKYPWKKPLGYTGTQPTINKVGRIGGKSRSTRVGHGRGYGAVLRGLDKKTKLRDANIQVPSSGDWVEDGLGPYMSQGATYTQRIGRRINLSSVFVRGRISFNSVLNGLGQSVRVMVVMDRDPAGADATTTMMMKTDNEILSPYNDKNEYAGRFKILFDQTYDFGANEGHKTFSAYLKGPTDVIYNESNNGNVTDLEYGHFMICACSSGGAVVDVFYNCIFRYKDV